MLGELLKHPPSSSPEMTKRHIDAAAGGKPPLPKGGVFHPEAAAGSFPGGGNAAKGLPYPGDPSGSLLLTSAPPLTLTGALLGSSGGPSGVGPGSLAGGGGASLTSGPDPESDPDPDPMRGRGRDLPPFTPATMTGASVGDGDIREGESQAGGAEPAAFAAATAPSSSSQAFPDPGGSSQDGRGLAPVSAADLVAPRDGRPLRGQPAAAASPAVDDTATGPAAMASPAVGNTAVTGPAVDGSVISSALPPAPQPCLSPPRLGPQQQQHEEAWPAYLRLVTFNASVLLAALSKAEALLQQASPSLPLLLLLPRLQAAALAALKALLRRHRAPAAAATAEVMPSALLATFRIWSCATMASLRLSGSAAVHGSTDVVVHSSIAVQRGVANTVGVLQQLRLIGCGGGGGSGGGGGGSGAETPDAVLLASAQLLQDALMLLAETPANPPQPSIAGLVAATSEGSDEQTGPLSPPSPSSFDLLQSALELLIPMLSHRRPEMRRGAVGPACALAHCCGRGGGGGGSGATGNTDDDASAVVESRLVAIALEGMSDVDPAVAAASSGLLVILSGPALGAAMHSHADATSTSTSPSFAPVWLALIALRPQGLAFRPEQLQQLFELLVPDSGLGSGSGGLLLRRKAETAVDGEVAAATMPVWAALGGFDLQAVTRLVASLQPSSSEAAVAATGGEASGGAEDDSVRADGVPHHAVRVPPNEGAGGGSLAQRLSSRAALPWLLVQEGARSCVASKMRTHAGGPGQSFAALERMLHVACARLAAASTAVPPVVAATVPPPAGGGGGRGGAPAAPRNTAAAPLASTAGPAPLPPPPPPLLQQQQLRESTWLLLEMVGALERALHHACEGGRHQPPLPRGVLAFFAANT